MTTIDERIAAMTPAGKLKRLDELAADPVTQRQALRDVRRHLLVARRQAERLEEQVGWTVLSDQHIERLATVDAALDLFVTIMEHHSGERLNPRPGGTAA